MATIEQLTQLKKRADAARAERDMARGALESALARLAAEFGCKTIEEATALLARLETKAKKHEDEFDRACAAFATEFGDKL